MTPELRDRLLERLAVRAERLAKMAAMNAPTVVIALMAAHVATTSILLLGKTFADALFEKLVTAYRDSNGICICGNDVLARGEPLCAACIAQMDAEDRECEQQLAMHRPAKGQPS